MWFYLFFMFSRLHLFVYVSSLLTTKSKMYRACCLLLSCKFRRGTQKLGEPSVVIVPVPSPRGGFGGLIPPKQSSKRPQIETWNTKWLVECLSNLNVKPPLHERKASPHKHKAPLLTTFWRRFCIVPLVKFLSETLMEQHQQCYCFVIVPLFRCFFAAWEPSSRTFSCDTPLDVVFLHFLFPLDVVFLHFI